ncbi:sulfotransferase family 2 domain-containing protein [Celeribacter halophilus]|uniref:Sulfotransferase family protein n=1 Tax=Celeribacter halophilus TaxID=576117 RepID=A0A1I3UH29_9RHOB|nr:sulfotransferase family 2 domain-containing protein [Celeribacter halophilus]PZX10465.1 sulfotransferase family protein [Celeribacter halophilus]SFJ82155.1 Sulfotransferase family protein [Celeribacter halophilus]
MEQTHSNPQGKPPFKEMAKRNLRNLAIKARYRSLDAYPVTKLMPPRARKAMLSRICYFPKYNLYYARLPKCANTTIVRTLANSSTNGLENVSTAWLKTLFNRLPSTREFEQSYKFVVLRDPVERVVSAWRDKGHHPAFIQKHRYAGDETTVPTLEQFLTGLRNNDFYKNAHYLPQMDMIPGPLSEYDVGTVDQLEPFLAKVCHKAFGRYQGLQNEQAHSTDARKRVLDISDLERNLIKELYAEDIASYAEIKAK